MNRSFAGSRLIAWQDVYFLAVVGLIVILRSLRLRRLNDAVARGAALVAYHFSLSKRRRVEANLSKRLGGGHSVAERQRIVRRTFYETWRELFSWADSDVVDETAAAVDIHGLEHLRTALCAGHGAILWESNGLGRRKVMKRILRSRGIDLHQVHGSKDLGGFLLNDPPSLLVGRLLRKYFDRCEKQFVVDTRVHPALEFAGLCQNADREAPWHDGLMHAWRRPARQTPHVVCISVVDVLLCHGRRQPGPIVERSTPADVLRRDGSWWDTGDHRKIPSPAARHHQGRRFRIESRPVREATRRLRPTIS